MAFKRGEDSPDAMLGALMEAEFQGAMLSWMESWGEFVKAWAKVQRSRRKRR